SISPPRRRHLPPLLLTLRLPASAPAVGLPAAAAAELLPYPCPRSECGASGAVPLSHSAPPFPSARRRIRPACVPSPAASYLMMPPPHASPSGASLRRHGVSLILTRRQAQLRSFLVKATQQRAAPEVTATEYHIQHEEVIENLSSDGKSIRSFRKTRRASSTRSRPLVSHLYLTALFPSPLLLGSAAGVGNSGRGR
ncbi:unnamed protein product, partial [Urochloa humidicola]